MGKVVLVAGNCRLGGKVLILPVGNHLIQFFTQLAHRIRFRYHFAKPVLTEVGNSGIIAVTTGYDGNHIRINLGQFLDGFFAAHAPLTGKSNMMASNGFFEFIASL
jgi:hypothetical protein